MVQVDEDLQETVPHPRLQGRTLRIAGLIGLAIAVLAVATGLAVRWRHEAAVKQWTLTKAVPIVSFVLPRPDGSASRLILPGDIQAWFDAPIFARVNGFLKSWYFDYGATVKAGQVLAEIEAPDLDATLAAAQAKLGSSNAQVKVREAELGFAKTTYERWRNSPKGVVAVQETTAKKGDFDSATARLNAALADVRAAQGEVDRLEALERFKLITAPFDGVVTERNTDVGALINAGSGVGGELVQCSSASRMSIRCAYSCRCRRGCRLISVRGKRPTCICRNSQTSPLKQSLPQRPGPSTRVRVPCWSNCMPTIRMVCCSQVPIPRCISICRLIPTY